MGLDISIKNWIHYNPSVGVEAMHVVGLPGTGKSNMSTGLMAQCVSKKDEILLIPGDRFCEWRHFVNHDLLKEKGYKVKVIVPKGVEIFYHPNSIRNYVTFVEVDYETLNIFDHIDDTYRILAIYDAHLLASDRAKFWADILEVLLTRTQYIDIAIGILFHEAGVLFRQLSKGDHWRGIQKFSELFVESRKGLVRTIFVSQIETELESTIRGKCLYHIFRKCFLGKRWPLALQNNVPFQKINQYAICYGGLYLRDNIIEKFYEKKEIYKMIPPTVRSMDTPHGAPKPQVSERYIEANRTHNGILKRVLYDSTTGKIVKWLGPVEDTTEGEEEHA